MPDMTVAENITLGDLPTRSLGRRRGRCAGTPATSSISSASRRSPPTHSSGAVDCRTSDRRDRARPGRASANPRYGRADGLAHRAGGGTHLPDRPPDQGTASVDHLHLALPEGGLRHLRPHRRPSRRPQRRRFRDAIGEARGRGRGDARWRRRRPLRYRCSVAAGGDGIVRRGSAVRNLLRGVRLDVHGARDRRRLRPRRVRRRDRRTGALRRPRSRCDRGGSGFRQTLPPRVATRRQGGRHRLRRRRPEEGRSHRRTFGPREHGGGISGTLLQRPFHFPSPRRRASRSAGSNSSASAPPVPNRL